MTSTSNSVGSDRRTRPGETLSQEEYPCVEPGTHRRTGDANEEPPGVEMVNRKTPAAAVTAVEPCLRMRTRSVLRDPHGGRYI
jgi:hypothetical protein